MSLDVTQAVLVQDAVRDREQAAQRLALFEEDEDHTIIIPRVVRCPFQYNTPGLNNGVDVYKPVVNELLFNAWIEITQKWNGTTPKFDAGRFIDENDGWWVFNSAAVPLDVTEDKTDRLLDNGVLTQGAIFDVPIATSSLFLQMFSTPLASGTAQPPIPRSLPAKFTTDDPVKIVVSTTGSKGGSSPSATHGSAIFYMLTAR